MWFGFENQISLLGIWSTERGQKLSEFACWTFPSIIENGCKQGNCWIWPWFSWAIKIIQDMLDQHINIFSCQILVFHFFERFHNIWNLRWISIFISGLSNASLFSNKIRSYAYLFPGFWDRRNRKSPNILTKHKMFNHSHMSNNLLLKLESSNSILLNGRTIRA